MLLSSRKNLSHVFWLVWFERAYIELLLCLVLVLKSTSNTHAHKKLKDRSKKRGGGGGGGGGREEEKPNLGFVTTAECVIPVCPTTLKKTIIKLASSRTFDRSRGRFSQTRGPENRSAPSREATETGSTVQGRDS